jgi:hypothetical protein
VQRMCHPLAPLHRGQPACVRTHVRRRAMAGSACIARRAGITDAVRPAIASAAHPLTNLPPILSSDGLVIDRGFVTADERPAWLAYLRKL